MSFNFDSFDGRAAFIAKHHKTLKTQKVVENTDDIDSDRVPYEDLQRPPNPYTGYFTATYDEGTVDICAHEGYIPRTAARIHFRNVITSEGARQTLVSLQLPEEK